MSVILIAMWAGYVASPVLSHARHAARIVRVQEYNFSPGGATYQREEQRFNRRQVTHLRLTIVPNKSGSGTATLTALLLFA